MKAKEDYIKELAPIKINLYGFTDVRGSFIVDNYELITSFACLDVLESIRQDLHNKSVHFKILNNFLEFRHSPDFNIYLVYTRLGVVFDVGGVLYKFIPNREDRLVFNMEPV